ncbi:cold-shock protein [Seongchinamella unica]|uniref:Cold-shock protein n=1 Tax=Seongchinamella unica TaxID=2547392 RepID=A0A4R5LNX5_9GAMM|nr:cold-shock protein [Seongchinamella unica]
MNLVGKIVIALLVAGAAWALLHFVPAIPTPVGILIATLATALLSSISTAPVASTERQAPRQKTTSTADVSGPREEGEVKWFNVSKGFGFITKDDGEEIFVHFRSIRGDGRRGLRDGQRVSFVEAQTEKGPQAEDVEPL